LHVLASMSRIGHDSVSLAENPNESVKKSERKKSSGSGDAGIAGAVTGGISRMIVQPFDVLKIRFQLQAEEKARAKYKSLVGASVSIAKEEGISALWKGHVSGQCLSVLFASVQFGLYQGLWQWAHREGLGAKNAGTHSRAKVGALDVAFGAAAAVPATVVSYPFDVVRTRMVGQGGPSNRPELTKAQYKSLTDAFVRMVRVEGPSSLFQGLSPALYTVPLSAGLHLCIYNYIKPGVAKRATHLDQANVPYLSQVATFLLGGISGVITKTITFPLDTVKKRLQVQGFAEGRLQLGQTPKYNGFAHCCWTVLRTEGLFRGLFEGWAPGVIKAFPSGAIQFYLLETTMYLIAKLRSS